MSLFVVYKVSATEIKIEPVIEITVNQEDGDAKASMSIVTMTGKEVASDRILSIQDSSTVASGLVRMIDPEVVIGAVIEASEHSGSLTKGEIDNLKKALDEALHHTDGIDKLLRDSDDGVLN